MIQEQEQFYNKNSFLSTSIYDIKFKNLLVVGAGGIGCELLKCLVQTGFKRITIVDLDKIEKSNLNRQFLFDTTCVGNFKSEMAKRSIYNYKKYDQELQLDSYVGNIKDKTIFDNQFFRKFDLILNALDNVDARTYINKICIHNNIPLINSGTEGYLGYAASYIKELTPCYNCAPKNKKKAIPICSIRSKPEKIEHCVAWAKSLFELLFTENSNGNLLEDYKIDEDPIRNYQNYFYYNVQKEKGKDTFSTANIKSIDINQIILYEFADFFSDLNKKEYEQYNKNINRYDEDLQISSNLSQLILILMRSTESLKLYIDNSNGLKLDKFDKENKDIVNFVYAATCLRCINFSIKPETRFKIKEIAGNIIPAIASTNSIIAGIQTNEAVKVLKGLFNSLRTVNYNKERKIASIPCADDFKNLNCEVCSVDALRRNRNRLTLEFNFSEFTLGDLLCALETKLKLNYFLISVRNNLLYEQDEGLDEEEEEYYRSLKMRSIQSFNIKNKDELKFSNNTIGITIDVVDNQLCNKGFYNLTGEIDSSNYPITQIEEEFDVLPDEINPRNVDTKRNIKNTHDGRENATIEENSKEVSYSLITNENLENIDENKVTSSTRFIQKKRPGPEDIELHLSNGHLNSDFSLKKRRLDNGIENPIYILDDGLINLD